MMTSLGDKGEGHRETTALLGNEDEGSVQTQTKVLNQGSWTQVSCPCCVSEQVEPLVLIQLSDNIQPVTKRWLISLIEVSERDGGAALLAHPGEDECGDVIVVSAPRCTLLRATEDLGLCKKYHNGDMVAFSYNDRDNFRNVDDMQEFLTLAERQYIVKYELDFLRAQKGQKIPGVPESQGVLKARENICQKLEKAGVIKDIFPLHDKQRLTDLCRNWYSGKQIWGQPLDSIQAYFGGTVGFYFSFLDFYTWALVPPAILGLVLTFLLPGGGSGAGVVKEQAGGVVEVDDSPSVSGHMVQAVFSMLWSTLVMEFWKRRSSSLSHRWGLLHLAERFAEPRPGFHGTLGINPVTGRLEPLFPEWQRQLRVGLVSVPLVGFFLGMVVLGMTGFYHGEALAQGFHQDSDSLFSGALLYLPSVAHIIYTNMLGNVYRTVAMQLTEWENHREESSFQNHHTTKVLLEADLAVASLTLTATREQGVEMSTPFMQTGIGFILSRDVGSEESHSLSFLFPFSTEMWVGILLAFLVTGLCIYLVSRISPCEWADPETDEHSFTLLHSFWYITGALTLQGAGPHPKGLSGRVISAIWWVFAVVLLACYFSNFNAMLRSDSKHVSVNNFEELAKQDVIDYGTVEGGSTFNFFKNSKNPTYRRIYQHMERKKSCVASVEEGNRRTQEGNYAFIGEAASLDLAVARYCNLIRSSELIAMRGYSIAAPLGKRLAAESTFTFFNYFAVLFHIAFYKQDLSLLRKRLASLLIVTQLVNQCTEVVVPFIVDRFFSAPQKKQQEDDPNVDKLRAQRSLPPFPGLFAEYIELLVQFGYLSLFSCVYPLTAVLLLLNNVTEIRADAYKICKLFRKPFSAPVSNIGVWQTAFEVLGFVSVMSNCWLLLLSPRVREFCLEGGISGRNIILFAILVEHVLILVKMILAFMIPDEPDWVRIKREQIEFHSMQALGQQKL
ncbi:unnamed protein product [Oncorhynchus mykiss]|uniref:Anoctamin n=1 Tax=Oncorhynchus mykiss TaxID=8022 RepID=A0A060VWX3_ONCMY|nr:unnamed protein product [Oncorhynchus mykiss]